MADCRKSWRPRFSLRTLATVVTLSAVIAGWFTQSALRQRRAVAELTKLGADVLYEHKADPRSTSWCPKWLRDWLGVDFFAEATEVQFGFNAYRQLALVTTSAPPKIIVADAMQQLCSWPHLRKLTLFAQTINQAKTSATSAPRYAPVAGDRFVFDPQNLQLLKGHPTLEEFDLRSMPADDELLAGLHGFLGVKRLRLGPPNFPEQGARHLGSLSNLQELAITSVLPGNIFPPRSVSLPDNFPTLDNLRALRIPNYTISNQTARYLSRLPKIETLICSSIAVDDEGLRFFTALSQLQELNLIDSRITDVGAEHLAKLTELRKLILTNNRITDDGLRHLATLTKLQTLYMPHLPITDAGLAHLRGATAMQVLVSSSTKITDAGLVHLSAMSDLRSLDLSFTAITDESIDQILRFKKLTKLRLLGTRITRHGAGRLRQAFPAASIDLPDSGDPPKGESPQASP